MSLDGNEIWYKEEYEFFRRHLQLLCNISPESSYTPEDMWDEAYFAREAISQYAAYFFLGRGFIGRLMNELEKTKEALLLAKFDLECAASYKDDNGLGAGFACHARSCAKTLERIENCLSGVRR